MIVSHFFHDQRVRMSVIMRAVNIGQLMLGQRDFSRTATRSAHLFQRYGRRGSVVGLKKNDPPIFHSF